MGVILIHTLRGALKMIFISIGRKLRHQRIPLVSHMTDLCAINCIKICGVEPGIKNRILKGALGGLIRLNPHCRVWLCNRIHTLSPIEIDRFACGLG